MKKLFMSFAIAAAAFCHQTSAQSFKSMWEQAEQSIEAGASESAFETVSGICEKAISKGNDFEILNATAEMRNLVFRFMENPEQYFADHVRSIIPHLHGNDYKAIAHMFLAIAQLSIVDEYRSDDNLCLYDSVDFNMNKAIELARSSDHKASRYSRIFERLGSMGWESWRLTDEILYAAIELCWEEGWEFPLSARPVIEDRRMAGTAQEFIDVTENLGTEYWCNSLRWLRELTLRNMKSAPSIRCDIDINRISMLDFNISNDTLLFDAYENVFNLWGDLTDRSCEAAYMALVQINNSNGNRERKERGRNMCLAAIARWPDSPYVKNCKRLVGPEADVNLLIELNTYKVCAGIPNAATIRHRNAEKIWFRVVERDSSIDTRSDGEELLHRQTRQKPLHQWSIEAPGISDNRNLSLEIPALTEGSYSLLASNDSIMSDKSYISIVHFDCYSLTFVQMNSHDGFSAGQVIDIVSGAPVNEYSYSISRTDGTAVCNGHQTGILDLSNLKPDKYILEYESDGRHGRSLIEIPADEEAEHNYWTRLFTDRNLYRPGDTVRYTGFIAVSDSLSQWIAVSGLPVQVKAEIKGTQDILTMDHVTDSFGAFQGWTVIPAEAVAHDHGLYLHASYSPEGQADIIGNSCTCAIRTDDAGGFQVSISHPDVWPLIGDTLSFTGSARTLFGQPGAGAVVDWHIYSERGGIQRGHGVYRQRGTVITSGRCVTDREGLFRIQFCIGPNDLNIYNESLRLGYPLRLEYHITYTDGQTYSGRELFPLFSRNQAVWKRQHNTVRILNAESRGDSILLGYGLSDLWNTPENDMNVNIKVHRLQDPEKTAGDMIYDDTVPYRNTGFEAHTLAIPISESGHFRIYLSCQDTVCLMCDSIDCFHYIPGSPCTVPSGYLLKAVTDRKSYERGDTVTVYAGSCKPGTRIFWLMDKADGLHGSFIADGSMQELRIPLGNIHKDNLRIAMGAYNSPSWAWENLDIRITDSSRKLKLTFDSFPDRLEPGSPVRLDMSVTDSEGKPVRARIILDMVDTALDDLLPRYLAKSRWGSEAVPPLGTNRSISLPAADNTVSGSWQPDTSWGKARYNDNLIDEALQGRIAGLDIAFISASDFLASNSHVELTPEELQALVRSDLDPTGLFHPGLETDDQGHASITFTAPDRLTDWHFQAFAYTVDMKGTIEYDTVITRRNIMVRTSAPQFLVSGDSIDFTASVTSAMDRKTSVKVQLELSDAATMRKMDMTDCSTKVIELEAGESALVSFPVKVPATFEGELMYRITASSGRNGDGEQGSIPVIGTDGSIPARIAFDYDHSPVSDAGTIAQDMAELFGRQNPDGGWAWIPDGTSRLDLSMKVMLDIACLVCDGILETDGKYSDNIGKGMDFIDNSMKLSEQFRNADPAESSVNGILLDWILLHNMLPTRNVTGLDDNGTMVYEQLRNSLMSVKPDNGSLEHRAKAAVALAGQGLSMKRSAAIANSLVETSLHDEETGRWWRDNRSDSHSRSSQIATQNWIIRALKLHPQFALQASQAALWLENCLNSNLDEYHRQTIQKGEFGKSGLAVSRSVTFSNGVTKPIKEGAPNRMRHMKTGDKVTVTIEITTDRPVDCVQLSDMLSACLTPVNPEANYGTTTFGISDSSSPDSSSPVFQLASARYYCAPNRYGVTFLIEHLDRGQYTIIYDCSVTQSGSFYIPLSIIQ